MAILPLSWEGEYLRADEKPAQAREMRRQAYARFRHMHPNWDREYRRVYQRKLRGTVSEQEWREWRRDNGPGYWLPLETWRAGRKSRLRAYWHSQFKDGGS